MSEVIQAPDFERQKTHFFVATAMRSLAPWYLHKARDLWKRDDEGKREWGNVSEHCLVESARVEVFADLLGFSEDLKKDLSLAAATHDFYKKDEIAKLRANGTSWEAYAQAQVEAKAVMDTSPLSDRVKYLATAVGHETLGQAEDILAKPELEPTDVAWLIMHYTDDYTINSDWATPATMEDGVLVNDMRRRMDRNRQKAQPGGQYHGIHLAGVEHLGELTYDAQERVGLLVEARLAALVSVAIGEPLQPALLPEFIDQYIKVRITA